MGCASGCLAITCRTVLALADPFGKKDLLRGGKNPLRDILWMMFHFDELCHYQILLVIMRDFRPLPL